MGKRLGGRGRGWHGDVKRPPSEVGWEMPGTARSGCVEIEAAKLCKRGRRILKNCDLTWSQILGCLGIIATCSRVRSFARMLDGGRTTSKRVIVTSATTRCFSSQRQSE